MKKISMGARLWRLAAAIIIPMLIVVLVLTGVLAWYNRSYNTILQNVTSASAFNQNFKDEVDLKMYYYVCGSVYSEGKPIEEVENARKLAESLLEDTTEKNSREAIESVRNLCLTLETRMEEIDEADSYDEGMLQLENNIYILTDLIQTYMYDYLYYESVHLNNLQLAIQERIETVSIIILVGFLLVVLLVIATVTKITGRITDSLKKLTSRVEDITRGDFRKREPIVASETEIQKLSDGMEEMAGRLDSLIQENKRAERRKRHAELELLQAQINPHFLYNTLDTIIWLSESDKKQESIEMVSALSDFFRSCLSSGKDIITIQEEEKHVKSYLSIQKVRYQDRMSYDVSIPEELYGYAIPKLTLQPLVENSIYHGIKLRRGMGTIHVEAHEIGDKIELTVKDDGAGMTEDRLKEMREVILNGEKVGFGLRTVHERIQLFFGEEYGLTISSAEGVGTTIAIVIPKRLPGEEENQK